MKVGRQAVDYSQPALLAKEVLPSTGFGILIGVRNPQARTVKLGQLHVKVLNKSREVLLRVYVANGPLAS